MQSLMRWTSLMAAVACMTACASLSSTKLPTANRKNVLDAYPTELVYPLPMTVIRVTGTVTLNDCDSIINPNTPLSISENFVIQPIEQPDPEERYGIPLSDLESWKKQLNLTINRNPDGTLASINGAVVDQVGPMALAAIQTVVSIGGAVALAHVAVSQVATTAGVQKGDLMAKAPTDQLNKIFDVLPANRVITSDAIDAALTKANVNDDRVRSQVWQRYAQKVDEKKRRVAQTTPPPVSQATDYCKDDVQEALRAIKAQKDAINAAQKSNQATRGNAETTTTSEADQAVATAQARLNTLISQQGLSKTFVAEWRPKKITTESGLLLAKNEIPGTVPASLAHDWLRDSPDKRGDNPTQKVAEDARTNLNKSVVLQLMLDRESINEALLPNRYSSKSPNEATNAAPSGKDSTGNKDSTGGKDSTESQATLSFDGLVYRDPAIAHLRVCHGECTDSMVGADGGDDVSELTTYDTTNDISVVNDVVPISQFGRKYVLSMKNFLFQSSSATLVFNTNGSIASVGTQASNAAATQGFGAAATTAATASQALTGVNTAITAANGAITTVQTNADTVNKALADCYTQQQVIIKAGGRPAACQ